MCGLCAQQKGPCLDLIMEEGSRSLLVHRIKMIIHVSGDISVLNDMQCDYISLFYIFKCMSFKDSAWKMCVFVQHDR